MGPTWLWGPSKAACGWGTPARLLPGSFLEGRSHTQPWPDNWSMTVNQYAAGATLYTVKQQQKSSDFIFRKVY